MAVCKGSEAVLQPSVPHVQHDKANPEGQQQQEQHRYHDGSHICGSTGFCCRGVLTCDKGGGEKCYLQLIAHFSSELVRLSLLFVKEDGENDRDLPVPS